MDFGTALSVALTAPVLVELAKGVAAWLARTHDSKVTITCPDGTVAAENINARQAIDLIKALRCPKQN